MLYTIPDYYHEFSCVAGKCEDTCCAGWQIVADEASLEKYKNETQKGEKVALVATGLMVQEALEAAKKMETAPTVVNIHTIKPIDKELIVELAKTHDKIVTCEEHSIIGGLGSAVAEVLAEAGTACKLVRVGVQDVFGESGKPAQLFAKYKIDADAIVEAATK